MKQTRDFIGNLRREAKRDLRVTKSDPWKALTHTDAVVQRDMTEPVGDGSASRQVKLTAIRPDPNQPRRTIDPEALRGLADSIRENGVLQPITVTWSESDHCYLILTGQRRFEAAKLAGLDSIPATIRPITFDERQRLQQQLVENLQREGIRPIEEARAIEQLMIAGGLSQRAAAKRLGKPQTYVAELLQILRIPDELLSRGRDLPKHSLIQIAKVVDATEQAALMDAAIDSPTPYKAVIQEQRRRTPIARQRRFRQTFAKDGFAGTVTVTFEKSPEDVTPQEVARFLAEVAQSIVESDRSTQ